MVGKAYVYLALVLLIVGIQVATSKSVDEIIKDERYNDRPPGTLLLSKRAAKDEDVEDDDATAAAAAAETDTTEAPKDPTPIWVKTTAKPSPAKRRRQSAKASATTTTTTTTELPEEEEVEEDEVTEETTTEEATATEPADEDKALPRDNNEDVATVKPLTGNKRPSKPVKDRKSKPSKPTTSPAAGTESTPDLASRLNGEEDGDDEESTPKPKPKPQQQRPQQRPQQGPPASVANNLLPPMPYYYPPGAAAFYPAANLLPAAPYYPAYAAAPPAAAAGAASPYHYPNPTGPAFSDSVGVGGAVGFASASASASAGGDGGTITATSTFPGGQGQPQQHVASSFSNTYPSAVGEPGSFIHTRGSFGGNDDDSVAIEVNGPAAAGVPQYSPQSSVYQSAGPGMAYQSASSFAGNGPSPFVGGPFGFGAPSNQQDLFQQYFAALRAQHEAFQRQLQAQILSQQQAIWDQNNRLDSNLGGAGDSNGEPVSAYGAVSLGPKGGFQSAQISPAAPGIFSRFGESVPPPSGNVYGVFSSSSSSSQTGPDGKTVSRKSSTVGVNDNGKISVKTVHDP